MSVWYATIWKPEDGDWSPVTDPNEARGICEGTGVHTLVEVVDAESGGYLVTINDPLLLLDLEVAGRIETTNEGGKVEIVLD